MVAVKEDGDVDVDQVCGMQWPADTGGAREAKKDGSRTCQLATESGLGQQKRTDSSGIPCAMTWYKFKTG